LHDAQEVRGSSPLRPTKNRQASGDFWGRRQRQGLRHKVPWEVAGGLARFTDIGRHPDSARYPSDTNGRVAALVRSHRSRRLALSSSCCRVGRDAPWLESNVDPRPMSVWWRPTAATHPWKAAQGPTRSSSSTSNAGRETTEVTAMLIATAAGALNGRTAQLQGSGSPRIPHRLEGHSTEIWTIDASTLSEDSALVVVRFGHCVARATQLATSSPASSRGACSRHKTGTKRH
jgi:hypothetical protein